MIRETVNALAGLRRDLRPLLPSPTRRRSGAGAQLAFPSQAEGSLIERDGKVIGSELIAQPFASDKYFHPRPSAAGPATPPTRPAARTWGPRTPTCARRSPSEPAALKATPENPAPADLVTASGGGLGPGHQPRGGALPGRPRGRGAGLADRTSPRPDRPANRPVRCDHRCATAGQRAPAQPRPGSETTTPNR